MLDILEEHRFASHIEPEPNSGCWIWVGAKIGYRGYGQIRRKAIKTHYAHRVIYELLFGPVPVGLELDHKCRVTACVNPSHLEAVSHRINMRRSRSATKTHCKRGHPLTGSNLWHHNARNRKGRRCRTCTLESINAMRARQRAMRA